METIFANTDKFLLDDTVIREYVSTVQTRRYPWGTQRLVSTHQLPHKSVWGRGTLDQLKSQVLTKFSFEGVLQTKVPSHSQHISKVPSPGQVFIGGEYSRPTQIPSADIFIWGGGTLDTSNTKYLSGGTQGILSTKFWQLECGRASQIVSHTLRLWRLMTF